MSNENEICASELISISTEMIAMLKRIESKAFDHFDTHPDTANWGDVGSARHYMAQLREISDQMFNEGEHAS